MKLSRAERAEAIKKEIKAFLREAPNGRRERRAVELFTHMHAFMPKRFDLTHNDIREAVWTMMATGEVEITSRRNVKLLK